MAAVRERRLNLTLQLPRFPSLPPLHPPPSSSDNNNNNLLRLSDFEKLKVIGHGNGGTVYKVRHRLSPNSTFVLKLLNNTPSSSLEPSIHRSTDSPHIVKLLSTFTTSSGDPALLLEHMDAGSLHSKKVTHNHVLAEICHQVLSGLSYLHSNKIAHRDIKPANLLINSNLEIKIGDFGVSKMMKRSLEPCLSYVGTCAYMSPEKFSPKYDAYKGDVWSLGLTVMELFLGRYPLLGREGERLDWAGLMLGICYGEMPEMGEGASEELKGFVGCCLRKEVEERWSVEDLLGHPFVVERDVERGREGLRELIRSSQVED